LNKKEKEMADWIKSSYMARSGVAKGKPGKTHQLTVEKQGKYHYVYGPYAEPVLTIDPGDVVVAETQDAFEGAIKSEKDKPAELLHMPFLNPQCGPIAVRGARHALRPHPQHQAARAPTGRHDSPD
jgi:amidase